VSALVDGGGGLGHPAARLAMAIAIEKAKTTGVGIVPVRNSAHFGACGFYALMAVEAGPHRPGDDVGGRHPGGADQRGAGPASAPTRSRSAPPASWRAVPARHGHHNVAAGKIRNKANENCRRRPAGWSRPKAHPAPIRSR